MGVEKEPDVNILANIAPAGPWGLVAQREDEVNWLQIVLVLVFIVGAGIVSLIKKAMEKSAEKRSRESIEQAERGEPPAGAPAERPPAGGRARQDPHLARIIRQTMGLPEQPPEQPQPEGDSGWLRVAPPAPPAAAGGGAVLEAPAREPPRPPKVRRKTRKKPAPARIQPQAKGDTTIQTPQGGTVVDLHDPDGARMAIIHYEILAPPKALRGQPEMWDL